MTKILIEKNIMVPMRDGVRLATDVYRLEGAGPVPVLMARTPYNKDAILNGGTNFDILRAVQAGYVVVVQDVRGRYASEGEFNPHFQETEDGVDAFAWAAAQPWSSGDIGTFGGSYLGCTQWLPAREQPPALRAMAPAVTFSDLYDGCIYQGGAKVLHDLRWVAAAIVPAEIERRVARGEAIVEAPPLEVEAALHELPLASHPLIRSYAAFYHEWLAHPSADAYWTPASPRAGYDRIMAPALNIGGWYDIFLWSTLENYMGMKRRGATEEARRQRLIIGPWTHMNFTGSFPDREFGPAASSAAIDLPGIHLRWFDRWLKGVDNGVDQEPPVMIFVMGADEWRTAPDWPLPGTHYRPYYLHSRGGANSLRGDGWLSTEPPGDEPSDIYLYNPLRPVPTVGGQVILPGANAMGPCDQRKVEQRDDVLVYDTPPLERAVEVIGPIELRLFVASSAPDTDFTGKLVDVHPDGRAIILTEGILRARYRNSLTTPELLEPGAIYELRLNLWATANVFLPGHRIRLEVSSSNFPRFDRNSNTGGVIAQEPRERYQPAVNRIFHDAAHPSCLILPILER
ncbi:CocE/NonD family hydrolase [Caldilinea sp.]|uniref:CocE/NonD family hydrolase n=1 Tax=Caldilinea sp. TaxID=2293560 RepID=UPI0021DBF8B7|nr:CocE/NonD family hydrolase [Caldilinea sp.]GIV69427.1 MAG: X-Pro dipeptidyl-peptidase [Caldilinea sp.]